MARKRLIAVMTAMALVAGTVASPISSEKVQGATTLKLKNVTNGKKTMYVGKSFTIKTNMSVSKLTFKSSKKSIATVSKKGVIKAKKKGSVVISVIAKIKNKKITKKIKLTVKKVSKATATPKATQTPFVDVTATPKVTSTPEGSIEPTETARLEDTTEPAITEAPTTTVETTEQPSATPVETIAPASPSPGITENAPVTEGTTMVTRVGFTEQGVKLEDANGTIVDAKEASNVVVSDDTYVTIVEPTTGDLKISFVGACSNGQIKVCIDKEKYPDADVDISLEGLELTNINTSPILVYSVDGCCNITVKKGTTNTLSDGEAYTNEDGDTGVIYSKDDLKLKGKGTLNITGNCGYGIISKDDLKIFNGTINVTSKDVCLKGKDTVKFGDKDDLAKEGAYDDLIVTLKSIASDAVRSNNPIDDETKVSNDQDYGDGKAGEIVINGGTISVNAYADGFQSAGTLVVNGGSIDIYTYEGSSYSNKTNEDQPGQGWWNMPGNTNSGGTATSDISAKGLKTEGNMTLNGGSIVFDTSDDAMHCGATLTINNGTYTIATGDDGVHSDAAVVINDGSIKITKAYEGVEGTDITINGGKVSIVSSDDGVNAAGGNSSSQWNTGFGGFFGGEASGNYSLTINGGTIFVNASGDGLDANGVITITGGTTIVAGPTNQGNSSIDCDSAFTYNGGVVLALDAGGMNGEGVPSNTQEYFTATLTNAKSVAVTDENGKVLSYLNMPKTMSRLVYMNNDTTISNCKLYVNGTLSNAEVNTDGYASTGTVSDGTEVGVTVGGSISSGNWPGNGFPGGGGRPW